MEGNIRQTESFPPRSLKTIILFILFIILISGEIYFSGYIEEKGKQFASSEPAKPEQLIEKESSALTGTEKSLLVFGYLSKYKEIPEEAMKVKNYLDEMGVLPEKNIETLYTTAVQQLISKGLIEDLPLHPAKEKGKVIIDIGITDKGEKVFNYLVQENPQFKPISEEIVELMKNIKGNLLVGKPNYPAMKTMVKNWLLHNAEVFKIPTDIREEGEDIKQEESIAKEIDKPGSITETDEDIDEDLDDMIDGLEE